MTPNAFRALFPNASKSLCDANRGLLDTTPLGDKPVPQDQSQQVPKGAVKRGMNKTEAEFERILKAQYPDDLILYEAIKLRLADGCWYCPDFVRIHFCLLTCYEVKGGHIWDDSKIKFKVAAEHYKWIGWEMHQKKKGTWTRIL